MLKEYFKGVKKRKETVEEIVTQVNSMINRVDKVLHNYQPTSKLFKSFKLF